MRKNIHCKKKLYTMSPQNAFYRSSSPVNILYNNIITTTTKTTIILYTY